MLLSGAYGTSKPGRAAIWSAKLARAVVRQRHVVAEPALAAPGEVQEQLDPERALGALDRAGHRVDALALGVVEQVAGLLVERVVEVAVAADQHGGAEARRAQHLVRVPDDRVGVLDAGQQAGVALGDQRRGAVRGVDVQPHAALAAELADRGQVVVQAGARRAGGRDERDRAPAGRARALQGVVDALRADALQVVGLELDHGVLAEAEDRGGPLDRVVRRGRHEQRQVGADAARPGVGRGVRARRQHRRQAGQRAAVGQHPAGASRPADLLDHPLEDRHLDRRGGGAHLVDRHRVVDDPVHEVGQRGRHVRHGDLVGQRARVVQARRAGEVVAQERAEALGVHAALAQAAAQVEVGHHVAERRVGDRRAVAAAGRPRRSGRAARPPRRRPARARRRMTRVAVRSSASRFANSPETTGARTQAGSGRGQLRGRVSSARTSWAKSSNGAPVVELK